MKTYRIGFLMFHNIGHITHDQRMRSEVEKHPEIQPEWMPIFPWNKDRWQKVPLIKNNQTLLMGFRARDHLRRQGKPFDVLYCHTQEPAILIGDYMRRFPTILSLDATPIQMNSFGHAYGRGLRSKSVEPLKHFLIRRSLHRATHLVAWSHWAKNSLINDYGIPESKVTVNSPGLDLTRWNVTQRERASCKNDRIPRVLFVGGDFRRKGGELLVQSAMASRGRWLLEIVTNELIPQAEGISSIRIHRGLKPGTPELLALYRSADIFVLPTLADCFSWVIMEAMAMRLPVISTQVGGIPELILNDETGLLIRPNSLEALTQAIEKLINSSELRRAMGEAGRLRVEQFFDGTKSYDELIALVKSVSEHPARDAIR